MKVFISSVIAEFEPHRNAAAAAARILGHEVIRAEDFPGSAESPQSACLAGVRKADTVLVLLGPRYGAEQQSGLSATHEEYREALERCHVLVFVQQDTSADADQAAFIREAQDWADGHYTSSFTDPKSLQDAITADLHQLELAHAVGDVDGDEMLQRALAMVPSERNQHGAQLALVFTGGPRQPAIRPSKLENPEFQKQIMQEALFGPNAIFTPEEGTQPRIDQGALVFDQATRRLAIDEEGSIGILINLQEEKGLLPMIIEETTSESLTNCLTFTAWLLDHIDNVGRLTHCSIAASILGGGYRSWSTRREHEQSSNSISYSGGMSDEDPVVHLTPPHRPRAALRVNARDLAEDLIVLLRRRWQQ